MDRETVYQILSGEREYQENLWGDSSQSSVGEFLLYMQDYMNQAINEVTRNPNALSALVTIRKITALGVACLEQHGAQSRSE